MSFPRLQQPWRCDTRPAPFVIAPLALMLLFVTAVPLAAQVTTGTVRGRVTDGATGEPIAMTLPAYFARFIYDADFATAEQVGYNSRLGRGNTVDNAAAVYNVS